MCKIHAVHDDESHGEGRLYVEPPPARYTLHAHAESHRDGCVDVDGKRRWQGAATDLLGGAGLPGKSQRSHPPTTTPLMVCMVIIVGVLVCQSWNCLDVFLLALFVRAAHAARTAPLPVRYHCIHRRYLTGSGSWMSIMCMELQLHG